MTLDRTPPQADFDALLKEHAGYLAKFARYNVGGIYDRDDVLQELRLCIWSATKSWSPLKTAKFSTYLYTAMRNRVGTLHRDQHRACRDADRSVSLEATVEAAAGDLHELAVIDDGFAWADMLAGMPDEMAVAIQSIMEGN